MAIGGGETLRDRERLSAEAWWKTLRPNVIGQPFKLGTDIKHIRHARQFLAPGGRLVALCANGPKQRAALQPIATEWHPLPPGSFRSEGTNVDAVLIILTPDTVTP